MKTRFHFMCAVFCVLTEYSHAQTVDQFSFFDDRISVGGEVRGRGEIFDDFYTPDGQADFDDEFFLYRSRLHLDVHPYDEWRVFVEVQDARQAGANNYSRYRVPNPLESDLDLYQGYLDLNKILGSPFSLRVGRQALQYGNFRLLGTFNWSNVARTFDAVKLSAGVDDQGVIDFFVGQPVIHDWGNFNTPDDAGPGLSDDNTLYGIYSTWKKFPFLDTVELYYLMRENDNAGDEVNTLGFRIKDTFGERWDWETEVAGQFGEFRSQDHLAVALHGEVGYTFDHATRPRVHAEYSYATGDEDPDDLDHETFDNLFPTNHIHYGQMDLFSWRNMHDLGIQASAKPMETLLALAAVHAFFLDEPESDAWYAATGVIQRNPAEDADAYVGTEVDLKAVYTVVKNLDLEAGYSHFFAGGYVDDTGESADADWGYVQVLYKF